MSVSGRKGMKPFPELLVRFQPESGSRRVVQKYLSDGLPKYPNSAEFIDFCCFLVRHKCAIFVFLKRKKAYVTRKPLIYLVVMGAT